MVKVSDITIEFIFEGPFRCQELNLAKLEVRDISKHFKVIGNSSPKTSAGAHSSHSSEVHSGSSSTTSLSGDGSPNGMMAAVENVTLNIEEGQFVCFVGPSGCGKTTLLNIIAGLDKPTKGEVILNGRPVTEPGPDRIMAGVEKQKRYQISMHYLEMMQLTKFAEAYTYQLSGGMKQRVSLARALVMDPEILLMDEPFAALDSQTRDLLLVELQLIWAKTRKTILFVTHNISESVCLGDRVIVFTNRPGKVKREIQVDYRRPRLTEDNNLYKYQREVLDELKTEIITSHRIDET